ncbi:MAG TPA: pyridoxal-phosphate dependent enzyme [Candidatus Thermoplasmatota archaeon]|nr:pyridoxal-phosphate dependent enzyme [Candidatus Thermoplasmatota archaeon]
MRSLADVGLKEIEDAARQIDGVAWRTPLLPASRDSDAPAGASSPLAGARGEREIFLKLETLQRTGSFKFRGAWNRMSRASGEEERRGFVTVSAGNHGQAVAWSARKLGAPCTVWVPEGAVARKVDAMRAMGATVKMRPHEEIMDAMMTQDLPWADGATFIHPFGDPYVMAGAGTVGLEIARERHDIRTVLVPVGGGGLVCGVATAVKALLPGVKVYGIQAEGAGPLPVAWNEGKPVNSGAPKTIADGIAATRVFDYMWPILRARLDGALSVSDEEIQRALVHLAKESHVVAEGAGAAALAAAWRYKDRFEAPIACVVSGGNIDPALLSRSLAA